MCDWRVSKTFYKPFNFRFITCVILLDYPTVVVHLESKNAYIPAYTRAQLVDLLNANC